jgi:ParB/RepB/Spo0J family partition protein
MKIKLNEIEVTYNPRRSFEGIDELANNISALGLLQPLIVASNGNGRYTLLDGQRRLQALQKLNWQEAEAVLHDLDEQQQKEVPIATDFFKDKLKLSEKAVGVANLINKEKKVTKEILAKRYGWKIKEVEALLKLATLQRGVLELIDNGRLEIKQALEITEVKREDIQTKVADFMVDKHWCSLLDALENVAYELPFDDVFTYEQAKKDNKIGIVVHDENYETDRVFTYDKEYYELMKKEYEEREQKSYDERVAGLRDGRQGEFEQRPEQKEETPEERKEKRKEAKAEYDKTLDAFRESTKSFLTREPSDEQIAHLIDKFVRQISVDNSRIILKSFGVAFKASEMRSDDFRMEVSRILKEIVKDESHLAKLIFYVDYLGAIYKTTLFDFDGVKRMIVKMDQDFAVVMGKEVAA